MFRRAEPSTDADPTAQDISDLDEAGSRWPVRTWEWASVTLVFTAIGLAALKYTFGIAPEFTVLTMVLGFMWAFVSIQVYGASGSTPTTTIAKGSQFITGAILRDHIGSTGVSQAALTNLGTAALSRRGRPAGHRAGAGLPDGLPSGHAAPLPVVRPADRHVYCRLPVAGRLCALRHGVPVHSGCFGYDVPL